MNFKKYIHKKKRVLRSMAAFMLAVLLVGAVVTVIETSATDSPVVFSDFTDPSGDTTPMPSGDVVSGLLGGISPAEIRYLNAHGQYTLYTAAIPSDKMYAHVHQGGVTVVAHEYTYTTADGAEVTWVPFFAENLTNPSELVELVYDSNQNLYVASLDGARSDTIKVYYAATLTMSEEEAMLLINEAPKKAKLLMDAMVAYEQELALWIPRKEAYDLYL